MRLSVALCTCLLSVGSRGGLARAEPLGADGEREPRATEAAVAGGAMFPHTGQAALTGYRGLALIDTGYDGVRASTVQLARVEGVLLDRAAPLQLSLFAGGAYGPPSFGRDARLSGFGGLKLQALNQTAHGLDLAAAARYTSLGFSRLPAVQTELLLSRRFADLTVSLNAAYGQSVRDDDRFGSVSAAALLRLLDPLFAGLDTKWSTDLERDQREPEFEPQYEGVASAILTYSTRYVAVTARAGVRALRYRLTNEARLGPDLGVSVATAL